MSGNSHSMQALARRLANWCSSRGAPALVRAYQDCYKYKKPEGLLLPALFESAIERLTSDANSTINGNNERDIFTAYMLEELQATLEKMSYNGERMSVQRLFKRGKKIAATLDKYLASVEQERAAVLDTRDIPGIYDGATARLTLRQLSRWLDGPHSEALVHAYWQHYTEALHPCMRPPEFKAMMESLRSRVKATMNGGKEEWEPLDPSLISLQATLKKMGALDNVTKKTEKALFAEGCQMGDALHRYLGAISGKRPAAFDIGDFTNLRNI